MMTAAIEPCGETTLHLHHANTGPHHCLHHAVPAGGWLRWQQLLHLQRASLVQQVIGGYDGPHQGLDMKTSANSSQALC